MIDNLDFGNEFSDENLEDEKKKIELSGIITPKHKMKFASRILVVAVALFILIASYYIFDCEKSERSEEVWAFSSLAISNIITLIIGFYFGDKS